VIDDVPRLATGLLQDDADVLTIRGVERDDGHFGVRLEDDHRSIEEGERGVAAGARANGVALPDERTVLRGDGGAADVTQLYGAVEDRELPARVEGGDGPRPLDEEPDTCDEQEQCRDQCRDHHAPAGERGHEEQRAPPLDRLLLRRRDGDDDRCGEATRRPADRIQKLALRRVLQDDARGTAVERGVANARIEREEDDPGVGELGVEAARDLEARELGHRVVEDDEIRAELDCLRHRLQAIGRLADDLEVRLGLEHGADALTYGEVIVRDQDPGRHFCFCSLCLPLRHR
jgi:hypothetical protein